MLFENVLSFLMLNIGLMEINAVTRHVRIHAAIVVGVAIIVYIKQNISPA